MAKKHDRFRDADEPHAHLSIVLLIIISGL